MSGSAGLRSASERRRIDGVVLIDKPLGMSSNAALQRVKRAYRARKAGHTGTLDPLATGLLPICLGEATKFAQGLIDSDKTYRTTIRLGAMTETGDVEGRVIRERPVDVTRDDIDRALAGFRGNFEQVPHRYSAIKRDGRRLYDYARAGEVVAVAPRGVRIDELDLEHWKSPVLELRVRCSKGTYIRSLAEDIGEALGCGAHVTMLRRIASGRFTIDAAIDVAHLEALPEPDRDARLLPLTELVSGLASVRLRRDDAVRFCHGLQVAIAADAAGVHLDALVAVLAVSGDAPDAADFLGLGRLESREGQTFVVPARLLATKAPDAASVAS
jgi:tRNA pseudouridine55 synthase